MTKREAESIFRSEVLPWIKEQENGSADHPRRSYEWNNFTDSLCKDGRITEAQYSSWYPPEICWSHREKKERRERRMRLVAGIMES